MGMLPVLGMDVQGPLHQDNSINTQQLQGTVSTQTNFVNISGLDYIFSFSEILVLLLYRCMRNEKFE